MARRRSRPAAAPERSLRPALLLLLVVAGAALALSAWLRPIDGDEGYYAAAAQLTADGARPYADYFYPQAPLLPYVYAPVVAVAGPSLRALRWLSVVLACGTVLVWASYLVRTRRGGSWTKVAALALLACSPDVISWAVTVKTYALTGLLSSLGLVALARGLETGAGRRWLVGAGAALGLAASARLFFAPLGPVLAAGLVLWPEGGGRRRATGQALALLGGFVLGCAPLVVAWLQDPDLAGFNNLGYHALRYSELKFLHPEPGLGVRLGAALSGTGRILATNPYLLGYLLLAAWGAAGLRQVTGPERRFLAVVALASAVFFLACMAPDPVHDQYFTVPLVPLGLPLAAAGLARLIRDSRRRTGTAVAVAAICGALVLGLLRPGMDPDPAWSLRSYDRVVAEIRRHSAPGDLVLSFWPGYVFGAGRTHFPGMENHFAFGVSEQLTPQQKARYHVADRHRLMDAFTARTPQLVVLGTWMNEINTALDDGQMLELLAVFQAEYEIIALHGQAKICAGIPR